MFKKENLIKNKMAYKIKKAFDISSKQGILKAEKFKAKLNNKYNKVNVEVIGIDKIRISGE